MRQLQNVRSGSWRNFPEKDREIATERAREPISGPELIQPQIELVETAAVDRVDAFRPFGGDGNEIAVQQRLEMLRYGGPADRQALRQFVDRFRCAAQLFQQVTPVRIRDGCEGVHGRHGRKLRQTPKSGKSIVRRNDALCSRLLNYLIWK